MTPAAIAPWLSVRDADAAVAFYRAAFDATVVHRMDGGDVLHVAQLAVQDASFWVQRDDDLPDDIDPGRAVRMIVEVADPNPIFNRALAAGATKIAAVHEEHGWRTGRIVDPFGHQWELARRSE